MNRIFEFLKNPHMPWFVVNIAWKISPSLGKFVKHGRVDVNTKSYWDKIYSSNLYQSTEGERHLELMEKIVEQISPESEVLDVACGSGFLMRLIKDSKNCNCSGIDISQVSIDIIRNMGFGGYLTQLPKMPRELKDKRFDFITVVEILEHLKHPEKTLNSLNDYLTENGRIITSVPNNCMGPEEIVEHLHMFDETSFRKLLEPFYDVESCVSVKSGVHEYLLCVSKRKS